MLSLALLALMPKDLPVYRFEIDPERTSTDGQLQLQFWSSGQLFGDYDPQRNQNGTQTRPGLGEFAGRINEPVLARVYWSFDTATDFHTVGTFDLKFDEASRKVSVSNYKAERLAEGPLEMRGSYEIDAEQFRSAQPAAIWAVDDAVRGSTKVSLNRLRFAQVPGERSGTLTPMEDGWYRLSVNFMSTVKVDVLEFDQSGPLEFTVATSLVGNVKFGERAAEFGYPRGRGGDNLSREVKVPMEDYQLGISHADGSVARFLLLQTIDKFAVRINGLRQFSARGTRLD